MNSEHTTDEEWGRAYMIVSTQPMIHGTAAAASSRATHVHAQRSHHVVAHTVSVHAATTTSATATEIPKQPPRTGTDRLFPVHKGGNGQVSSKRVNSIV